MPFEKGKSPGRPKGVKDSRSRYYDVMAALKAENHDPVLSLIRMAKNEDLEPDLRLKADKELIARIAPVLKAIEVNNSEENAELKAQADEMKKELKATEDRMTKQHKKEY